MPRAAASSPLSLSISAWAVVRAALAKSRSGLGVQKYSRTALASSLNLASMLMGLPFNCFFDCFGDGAAHWERDALSYGLARLRHREAWQFPIFGESLSKPRLNKPLPPFMVPRHATELRPLSRRGSLAVAVQEVGRFQAARFD